MSGRLTRRRHVLQRRRRPRRRARSCPCSAPRRAGRSPADVESHGLSAFGDLNYPEMFSSFAYVDPDAPKGGVFSQQAVTTTYNQNFNTFDSLHIYALKGDGAAGMGLASPR